ncbi:hypothetical protein ACFPN1_08850 [Lysobacter yangpyeongensis]|uniref:DUF2268 domain-containing protein n=1 Tax=Lysobacter yangpyeongensis TaxID=346182 RepID=A0ABW0SMM9_9GAMM
MNDTIRCCLAVAAFSMALPAAAKEDCPVVDLMPAYERVLATDSGIDRFRDAVTRDHAEIYNAEYVNALLAPTFTVTEQDSLAWVRAHRDEVRAVHRQLVRDVPVYLEGFAKAFPDFRCDFTFYIAPGFGHLDGSAAVHDGRAMIVFAPDVIAKQHERDGLRMIIDQELFHIYQWQVTHGAFGSFSVGVPKTYQSAWSEGLATYASWQMNPGSSLDEALLNADLRAAAMPPQATLAAAMLEHLDDADPAFFAQYFTGGAHPPGAPPRSGYYIGLLVARDLAMTYPITTMAALDDAQVRELLAARLRAIAAADAAH